MASTYLTRTNGTATNNKICTFSAWLKLASDSSYMRIFTAQSDVSGRDSLYLNSGELNFYQRNGTTSTVGISGNRLFRDVSAWYHLVVACDSTQATASDRIKIYLNGEQQTLDGTQIPQNQTFAWNEDNLIAIGADSDGSPSEYFDGSMSHIHFIDGTAYDATAFGQYDANGVWTIKTSPSVTYGTNGFFILKDGNSVTDQSGNSNNFTVGGGTLTNTEDNPSNVFATWNRLIKSPITLSGGNLQMGGGTLNWDSTVTTIVPQKGKWYAEIKVTSLVYDNIGFVTIDSFTDGTGRFYEKSNNIAWLNNVSTIRNYQGASSTTASVTGGSNSGFSRTSGDIVMLAFDMENGYGWFGKNGTWLNSGDPASGTNAFILSSDYANGTAIYAGYYSAVIQANFGNGYFGTTPVTSAGTNASGNGIFEYDVPTGFTALSTKGLNL